jgi:hypothetical protein
MALKAKRIISLYSFITAFTLFIKKNYNEIIKDLIINN